MPTYTISQGDCLSNVADAHGFDWKSLWNHPENAALRQKRKDPNVLFPGDLLFIPELGTKTVDKAVEQRHPFVLKNSPVTLKVRLLDGDQPQAGVPYSLEVDGMLTSGKTDGNGFLTKVIPAGAQNGKIEAGAGATRDVFQFQFGTVDPIEEESGLRGRLSNLGYDTTDLKAAIRAFQEKCSLAVTGAMDADTRASLLEKFGQ